MRKLGLLVAAATVWLAGVGMPSARAAFLSDFVDANGDSNGAVFHFDGLTFSGFTYQPTTVAPKASDVTVSGFTDVLGNNGITFGGPWTPTVNNPQDFRLAYVVTRDSGPGFTDIHMTANPTVLPVGETGAAIITETISAFNNPGVPGLGQIQVYSINNGGGPSTKLTDSTTWATPYQSLLVQKDILLNNGSGIASVSFIDQTFSPAAVPEPGSVVLMGLGCLGMIGYGLKRRRSMAV